MQTVFVWKIIPSQMDWDGISLRVNLFQEHCWSAAFIIFIILKLFFFLTLLQPFMAVVNIAMHWFEFSSFYSKPHMTFWNASCPNSLYIGLVLSIPATCVLKLIVCTTVLSWLLYTSSCCSWSTLLVHSVWALQSICPQSVSAFPDLLGIVSKQLPP